MVAADDEPEAARAPSSLFANRQRKPTAGDLNVMAGSFVTAGVVAAIVAAVFGFTGSATPLAAWTRVLGTRRPHGPEAVTDVQVLTFIIAPLMGLAVGLGVAYWARHADRNSTPRARDRFDAPGRVQDAVAVDGGR